LPFLILLLTIIHLLILHRTGSSNPIGLNRDTSKIRFHPYFSFKDLLGVIILLCFLFYFCLNYPYLLSDPDNFIPANSLINPLHIKPE
jgi:ubiquinol-cytochrome c reductase cytochrome b subunit